MKQNFYNDSEQIICFINILLKIFSMQKHIQINLNGLTNDSYFGSICSQYLDISDMKETQINVD